MQVLNAILSLVMFKCLNMSLCLDNVSNVSLMLYIVGKQVYHWYMRRRTVYCKFTSDKSGDGAKVYADREQFLKGHITRLTGRNIASVSIKNIII